VAHGKRLARRRHGCKVGLDWSDLEGVLDLMSVAGAEIPGLPPGGALGADHGPADLGGPPEHQGSKETVADKTPVRERGVTVPAEPMTLRRSHNNLHPS